MKQISGSQTDDLIFSIYYRKKNNERGVLPTDKVSFHWSKVHLSIHFTLVPTTVCTSFIRIRLQKRQLDEF